MATLPVVLNAMSGKGVHVVTVNDYLAKRDAEQMSAIYNFLGFSVGVILSSQNSDLEHKKPMIVILLMGQIMNLV